MSIAHKLRKRMRSRSKSLFLKIFMVSILLSFFIITILGIYIYYYIFRNLDTEIEKYERKKVTETINTSNILFGEMQRLTENYTFNNKITQFSHSPRSILSERYLDIQNIQDLISNTINSSNYIENLFIYYRDSNFILDYSGASEPDYYYDTGWKKYLDKMGSTSMILETRKVKMRTIETSNQYVNIITFMTGIPYTKGLKNGAVILNVRENIITDLLDNITSGNNKAYAFLVNRDGMILSSNKHELIFRNISDIIHIPAKYKDSGKGSFNLTLNGTKMVSYFETSSINSWKLFYIESKNDIFRKSVNIRNITFIIFFIVLLLTAAISLLVSSRVYNPIRRIIENIKRMTNVPNDNISDISMINGSLNLLFENNKNLERQLKQNEILIRETFLSQLIRGKIFNKNEIKSKTEYLSLNLDADLYKVAIIQNNSGLSNPFDIQQSEMYKVSAINMVTSIFSNLNIKVLCTQDSNDNILVLIMLKSAADVDEAQEITDQVLEDIKDSLNKTGLSVSVGIGRTYNDLSNVGVSCKEANEALRYRFLKGEQSVISYTDISTSEQAKIYYPAKYEQKLISFIKSCDYDRTILCLNEMLDDIIDHNKNFEHIKICLSNIIGIIQRCLFEMNLNAKEIFGEDTVVNMPVDRFKNMQHFTDWIGTIFRKIIEHQADLEKGMSKSIINEMKDYIEKVYMEEISLDSVARHFNYNSSYFCKIFKDKLGISFWEYVAKIRIEKSKKLLAETSDTVEQIAEKVGYNNRFSYIRTFKKCVLITPGEYRLKYKQ